MNENIANTLTRVAQRQGARTGLIEVRTGKYLSYAELDERANRYVSLLTESGVEPGRRVILMVRPSADFICLTFALFRLGAPVILIDPGMGYRNLLRCIEQVQPQYLIGIPPVILLSRLFPKPFRTVEKKLVCGTWPGFGGSDISRLVSSQSFAFRQPLSFTSQPEDLAAIIFTTGSTGPPKGVRFEHRIFAAQLDMIKSYYGIGPGDVDQPGFPLFALFSTALGACAVIPDMDPTRPAQVDPARFVGSLLEYDVTYSFGSPAIWNVVSRYCHEQKIVCPRLKKVLMAGAPVSGDLIERVYSMMEPDGRIFTPYGATESLPIVSIEGREIIGETWQKTKSGKGTCVGRPLPGISIRVVEPSDQPFPSIGACTEQQTGKVGEIIVKGPVVTRAYDNNERENRHSKVADQGAFWHRLGDVGYLDDGGRLWFCGRKAHRVNSKRGMLYTIPCEAITNNHPEVFRSALVGIEGGDGLQEPVMIIELEKDSRGRDRKILDEVRAMAAAHPLTDSIEHFLVHPSFPVDIRHNAKIFREKLAGWAQRRLGKKR